MYLFLGASEWLYCCLVWHASLYIHLFKIFLKAFEEAWINLDITKSQLDQMTTRLKQLTEQSLMVKKESDEYIRFCEEQDKILGSILKLLNYF